MGPYLRGHMYIWAYTWEEKHFILQSVKHTFSFIFSSIKHVFWHFSRHGRCEICLKLTIKTPEYIKLTINLKIDTVDVVLASL